MQEYILPRFITYEVEKTGQTELTTLLNLAS